MLDDKKSQIIKELQEDIEKTEKKYEDFMAVYIKAEGITLEAERRRKKAEIVSTTLEETVKQLRKQLKEHSDRYRSDVTTVFVTCDKES